MNNEEIEIVSESSSDDDLPDLFSDKDKTLSFHKENDPVITITFKINDNVFVQSFPHNTRSEVRINYELKINTFQNVCNVLLTIK